MSQRVGLVGHCGADTVYLRIAVGGAVKGADVTIADDEAELRQLIAEGVDLLLVNRLLEGGFEADEGVELIRQLRAEHPELKLMLVSNYDDAQSAAAQAGALPGFGKREIGSPRVKQLLQNALGK